MTGNPVSLLSGSLRTQSHVWTDIGFYDCALQGLSVASLEIGIHELLPGDSDSYHRTPYTFPYTSKSLELEKPGSPAMDLI